jgi:hypothetical protein
MTIKYMSFTNVAEMLGITKGALAHYKLPEPDCFVGNAKGWLPETIQQWDDARPRKRGRPAHTDK